MKYYDLNYLEKVDLNGLMNNENNYRKYVAKKLTNGITKTTDGWLKPYKLLPVNICEDKNILVEGEIIKKNKKVVKISKKKELLKKDYETSKKLEELKCINFAKYLGFFSCKDNIKNYNNNKLLPRYFCKNDGTINYFLFMDYYDIGSLVNYKPKGIEEIIKIINQIICSMTLAYERLGLVHGDLHPGNILIKKTKREKIKYKYIDREIEIKTNGIQIVIFDFDRSNNSNNFGMLLNEILTFINLYDSYLLENQILNINNISITPLKSLKKELLKITNLRNLKNIIGD